MKTCLLFTFLWSLAFSAQIYNFEGNTITIDELSDGFTYKVYRNSTNALFARFSKDGELKKCSYENRTTEVVKSVDSPQNVYQLIRYLIKLGVPKSDVLRVTYFSELETLCSTSSKVRRFKRQISSSNQGRSGNLIFPGTKWCGKGNISTSYNDLGEQQEADECCRNHDTCGNGIIRGETYMGLTNTSPFTMSSCHCDERFMTCLQYAGTETANTIGVIFFNQVGMLCYNFRVEFCSDPRVRSKCSAGQTYIRTAYAVRLPRFVPVSYDDDY